METPPKKIQECTFFPHVLNNFPSKVRPTQWGVLGLSFREKKGVDLPFPSHLISKFLFLQPEKTTEVVKYAKCMNSLTLQKGDFERPDTCEAHKLQETKDVILLPKNQYFLISM